MSAIVRLEVESQKVLIEEFSKLSFPTATPQSFLISTIGPAAKPFAAINLGHVATPTQQDANVMDIDPDADK